PSLDFDTVAAEFLVKVERPQTKRLRTCRLPTHPLPHSAHIKLRVLEADLPKIPGENWVGHPTFERILANVDLLICRNWSLKGVLGIPHGVDPSECEPVPKKGLAKRRVHIDGAVRDRRKRCISALDIQALDRC